MSDEMEVLPIFCGHCETAVAAHVVYGHALSGNTAWLDCPNCQEGSVRTAEGVLHPSMPAGRNVRNLPSDVERAWREVRTAHAVAAYTSAELMCRKILMHVAVDVVKSPPGESFLHYVEALDKAGYITTGMKAAVDKVRNRGNIATHELPASTEDHSLTTMAITEHLLRGIYEFSA